MKAQKGRPVLWESKPMISRVHRRTRSASSHCTHIERPFARFNPSRFWAENAGTTSPPGACVGEISIAPPNWCLGSDCLELAPVIMERFGTTVFRSRPYSVATDAMSGAGSTGWA